jgi:hypothetical protein
MKIAASLGRGSDLAGNYDALLQKTTATAAR